MPDPLLSNQEIVTDKLRAPGWAWRGAVRELAQAIRADNNIDREFHLVRAEAFAEGVDPGSLDKAD